MKKILLLIMSAWILISSEKHIDYQIDIYTTNVKGASFVKQKNIKNNTPAPSQNILIIRPDQKFQTIMGFGGAFTESTAYVLSKLSIEKRNEVIAAYFSDKGSAYSLCRTHINSCDFSIEPYAYANHANDTLLTHFDITHDEKLLIPLIKAAQNSSKEGFKLLASPWTAPPWMKDNNSWIGGKLKKEYYAVWALYFEKYLSAYQKHHIYFWGLTVENEPNGNGNHWESMHFTPREMTEFVKNYLRPQLQNTTFNTIKLLGYDQNRLDLPLWIDEMYHPENESLFDGTAIHWYDSTFEVFAENLQYAHQQNPKKLLIQTEACIDDEIPVWKNNDWYWQPHATDWGFQWAPENQKYLHPQYVPVYRYAQDIIGCMNNHVQGWIDWNMVLNKQGGPNHAKNWCIAPVIVDESINEVYYTPLYYILQHFSRYVRPEAVRIGFEITTDDLQVTAFENIDKSIVVVVLNNTLKNQNFEIQLNHWKKNIKIEEQSIQTLVIQPNN